MKTLITIAVIIAIVACQQTREQNKTKVPISLATDDLSYFVYSWHFPTGQWEFSLDKYVNIDKHGRFRILMRDSLNKTTYFTGTVNDTIVKLIERTFRVDTFKTDYKNDSLEGIAYSGYTYCFDYKTADKEEKKKVRFIQSRSPEPLRILSQQLDNLNFISGATQVDTLDIVSSIEEFKKFSAASLGEPPKVEKVKFKPVQIKP